jgi:hypothetical protein
MAAPVNRNIIWASNLLFIAAGLEVMMILSLAIIAIFAHTSIPFLSPLLMRYLI